MLFGMITTWDAIIESLGGTSGVAAALEQSVSTVSGWRKRPGGIPSAHWAALVRLAADVGRADITLEVLAELAARKVEGAVDFEEARA